MICLLYWTLVSYLASCNFKFWILFYFQSLVPVDTNIPYQWQCLFGRKGTDNLPKVSLSLKKITIYYAGLRLNIDITQISVISLLLTKIKTLYEINSDINNPETRKNNQIWIEFQWLSAIQTGLSYLAPTMFNKLPPTITNMNFSNFKRIIEGYSLKKFLFFWWWLEGIFLFNVIPVTLVFYCYILIMLVWLM